jgi:hypothetical protein
MQHGLLSNEVILVCKASIHCTMLLQPGRAGLVVLVLSLQLTDHNCGKRVYLGAAGCNFAEHALSVLHLRS